MTAGVIVIVVLFSVIAFLLRSGRPVPRHFFILELLDRLSRSETEEKAALDSQVSTAA